METGGKRVARLPQELFEEIDCAGIVGLAQPEQRGSSQLRVAVTARDPNEGRNRLIRRALRQGKDRMFADVPAAALITCDRVQHAGDRVSSGLTQPEDCSCASVVRHVFGAGQLEQRGPYDDTIRQRCREDRIAADGPALARQSQQV